MFRRKPQSDPRLIWDLERDLDIPQAGERRPLGLFMRGDVGERKRWMAEQIAEADRELRQSGERGFL